MKFKTSQSAPNQSPVLQFSELKTDTTDKYTDYTELKSLKVEPDLYQTRTQPNPKPNKIQLIQTELNQTYLIKSID